MNNPVWEWLVRSKLNAYQANSLFNGPSALEAGAGWCFDRFGQSSTQLPDGRIIHVAGEHEDHYDPDFYIYNDVVIEHADGRIDILGYHRDVFPPTDFHSATLVGNRIVLIGNLGYVEERKPALTPVFVLDLDDFAISPVETCGAVPGWVHRHDACQSDDGESIMIRGGLLARADGEGSLVENIDDWRLHLSDWRWERLTERQWRRWEIRRKDGKCNRLWEYQQALWAHEFPLMRESPEIASLQAVSDVPSHQDKLGMQPDLQLFKRRYQPELRHETLAPLEGEFGVHRIKVADVVVRFVEDMFSIQMTIEGDLPIETGEALASSLARKLSALENAPCDAKEL